MMVRILILAGGKGICASLCALFLTLAISPALAGAQTGAETEGKKLYRKYCLECHGESGRGDGPKSRNLGFRPRDFLLGAFKCRCTPSGMLPTDEDLFRTVSRGLPGSPMLAHDKEMSAVEIRQVIAYIKTLSPRFSKETAPACPEIPDPPAPADTRISEGKTLYRILQCWKCHGKTGRGDGPSAAGLKDDWGQPIKPFNFVVLKKFKCGGDQQSLYRTLNTGLTGSPMPSYAEAFLFAREDVQNGLGIEDYFGRSEGREIAAYLEGQPDRAALKTMSEAARSELRDRRTWSLVQYLRSLLGP